MSSTQAHRIENYLTDRGYAASLSQAVATGLPYHREGKLFIFAEDLATWLNFRDRATGKQWTAKEVEALLADNSGIRQLLTASVDGRRTQRAAWQLQME